MGGLNCIWQWKINFPTFFCFRFIFESGPSKENDPWNWDFRQSFTNGDLSKALIYKVGCNKVYFTENNAWLILKILSILVLTLCDGSPWLKDCPTFFFFFLFFSPEFIGVSCLLLSSRCCCCKVSLKTIYLQADAHLSHLAYALYNHTCSWESLTVASRYRDQHVMTFWSIL